MLQHNESDEMLSVAGWSGHFCVNRM